jgi:hypothetical protein
MFRHWGPTTVRTVDLGYDQMLVLQGRPGTRVRVLYGSAWLTEEGCAQDIFAGSGGEVALHGGGRAVVEGLGVARVQVIEPPRAQWWRRLKALVQRTSARLQCPTAVGVARRA